MGSDGEVEFAASRYHDPDLPQELRECLWLVRRYRPRLLARLTELLVRDLLRLFEGIDRNARCNEPTARFVARVFAVLTLMSEELNDWTFVAPLAPLFHKFTHEEHARNWLPGFTATLFELLRRKVGILVEHGERLAHIAHLSSRSHGFT